MWLPIPLKVHCKPVLLHCVATAVTSQEVLRVSASVQSTARTTQRARGTVILRCEFAVGLVAIAALPRDFVPLASRGAVTARLLIAVNCRTVWKDLLGRQQ